MAVRAGPGFGHITREHPDTRDFKGCFEICKPKRWPRAVKHGEKPAAMRVHRHKRRARGTDKRRDFDLGSPLTLKFFVFLENFRLLLAKQKQPHTTLLEIWFLPLATS